jgi:hypothetical protein
MTLLLSADEEAELEVDNCELIAAAATTGSVKASAARTGKDPPAADDDRDGAAGNVVAFDLD